VLILAFLVSSIGPVPARADEFFLPKPGTMLHLTSAFNLPVLKGIKI
jgi:hypothetical protein